MKIQYHSTIYIINWIKRLLSPYMFLFIFHGTLWQTVSRPNYDRLDRPTSSWIVFDRSLSPIFLFLCVTLSYSAYILVESVLPFPQFCKGHIFRLNVDQFKNGNGLVYRILALIW